MAHPMTEDSWLAMALRAAAAGSQNPKTFRALCWQALEVSRQGCVGASQSPGHGGAAEDPLVHLDAVLAEVKVVSQLPGCIDVKEAKQWLRARGPRGCKVASSLGALSKVRNTCAHPKSKQLVEEIRLLGAENVLEQASVVTEAATADLAMDCDEQLQGLLRDAQVQVAASSVKIQELEKQIVDVQEKVGKIEELENEVFCAKTSYNESMTAKAASFVKIEELEKQVAELQDNVGKIEELEKEVFCAKNSYDDSMTAKDGKIEEIQKQIDVVQGKVGKMENLECCKIEEIQKQIGVLQGKVGKMENLEKQDDMSDERLMAQLARDVAAAHASGGWRA